VGRANHCRLSALGGLLAFFERPSKPALFKNQAPGKRFMLDGLKRLDLCHVGKTTSFQTGFQALPSVQITAKSPKTPESRASA
jgi:hypothetical protein